MTYPITDNVVGPIIHALAGIVKAGIDPNMRVYEDAPDGPPEHNSCVIPPPTFKFVNDTNGKLSLKMTFGVRHVIRRKKLGESLSSARTFMIPYLMVFSAWKNQNLTDANGALLCREVTPSSGGLIQFEDSAQTFIAVLTNVDVLVDINTDTSL